MGLWLSDPTRCSGPSCPRGPPASWALPPPSTPTTTHLAPALSTPVPGSGAIWEVLTSPHSLPPSPPRPGVESGKFCLSDAPANTPPASLRHPGRQPPTPRPLPQGASRGSQGRAQPLSTAFGAPGPCSPSQHPCPLLEAARQTGPRHHISKVPHTQPGTTCGVRTHLWLCTPDGGRGRVLWARGTACAKASAPGRRKRGG